MIEAVSLKQILFNLKMYQILSFQHDNVNTAAISITNLFLKGYITT